MLASDWMRPGVVPASDWMLVVVIVADMMQLDAGTERINIRSVLCMFVCWDLACFRPVNILRKSSCIITWTEGVQVDTFHANGILLYYHP